VRFHFRLGYGAEMNALLLRGEIDFALVDEFTMDKKVKTEPVYDETLELCATPEFVKKAGSGAQDRKYIESLRYVDFSKDEQILRRWFKHHYGDDGWKLRVRSTIEDSQGVALLIQSGIGAGILPGHLVRKLERDGTKLHVFKGKGATLKNTISVAQLKDRSHTRSVQASLEYLEKEIGAANRNKKA
jgi:DNA-binding transcriptional LysR family regulator